MRLVPHALATILLILTVVHAGSFVLLSNKVHHTGYPGAYKAVGLEPAIISTKNIDKAYAAIKSGGADVAWVGGYMDGNQQRVVQDGLALCWDDKRGKPKVRTLRDHKEFDNVELNPLCYDPADPEEEDSGRKGKGGQLKSKNRRKIGEKPSSHDEREIDLDKEHKSKKTERDDEEEAPEIETGSDRPKRGKGIKLGPGPNKARRSKDKCDEKVIYDHTKATRKYRAKKKSGKGDESSSSDESGYSDRKAKRSRRRHGKGKGSASSDLEERVVSLGRKSSSSTSSVSSTSDSSSGSSGRRRHHRRRSGDRH